MKRSEHDGHARDLLSAWQTEIRPVLVKHLQGGELAGLDQAAALLERTLLHKTRLEIGFIGESQVGKSSIINALVGRSALPSGGIGPLTAQATQVAYADQDTLSVTYHDVKRLRGVRLSLETALARRGELPAPGDDDGDLEDAEATAEISIELNAVGARGGDDELDEAAIRAREAAEQRLNYLMDQLWSMLSDSSTGEVGDGTAPRPASSVLVDGLRAILGEKPRQPEALAPFLDRITEIRRYIGRSETVTSEDPVRFMQELELRAAHWLAPLVKELKVGLRSEVVRSLSLVDLPGIGVRADPGALVAEDFVGQGGDALVVVMRNNGLTQSVAGLLEKTGVIRRLLMEGESPVGIRVVIVVTHLDDVAQTRYQAAAREARARGQRAPEKQRIYSELASEMSSKVRADVRGALLTSPSADELTDERRAKRAQRIESLCAAMDVICVSAPNYLKLIEGFDDDAWLKDLDSTNVPALRAALERVAADHAEERAAAIAEAMAGLSSLTEGYLQATSRAYEEGRGAAREQWETFQNALEGELQRLRDQMNTSHGELLAELKTALPADIRLLCAEAEKGALKRVMTLRNHGSKLFYQSLNAALRGDGVWERRAINYPASLTEKFIEPIESDWDERVVGGIRRAMAKMVNRDVRLVEELCDVAASLDARLAGAEQASIQKQLMQQQAKMYVAFTKERLSEMTSHVSAELSKKIKQVMAAACKKALDAGVNRGTGAKKQILDAFEEGGKIATAKARERAEALLLEYYDVLRRELQRDHLADNHDPLTDAFNRLTDNELTRAKKKDARRAADVRAEVARTLDRLAPYRHVDMPDQPVSA